MNSTFSNQPRTHRLLGDQRGSGFVQSLVLVAALALGTTAAVKGLSDRLGEKLSCAGESIGALAPAPCAGGVSAALSIAPIPPPPPDEPTPSLPSRLPGVPRPIPPQPPSTEPTPSLPNRVPGVPRPIPPQPPPAPPPAPGPSAPPPAPPAPPPGQFSPENEQEVRRILDDALARHGGDVALAFIELRDLRQQPEHYFDTNLAIAADYLRARLEVQRNGPIVAAGEVEAYLALKQAGAVPQEGPGPVSPYSELQARYMRLGLEQETAELSFLEQVAFSAPPGILFGLGRFGFSTLRGDE